MKEKIFELKAVERIKDIKNIKKGKGYKTFYRIRIGDCRLGVQLVDGYVIFERFLHRKDIYMKYPR